MEEEIQKYVRRVRLPLKKSFKLSHGTYNFRENVFFLIKYKSFFGVGEAPVVPYYNHSPELIEKDLEKVGTEELSEFLTKGKLKNFDWDIPVDTMPARCAVESALIDLLSQISGITPGRYIGVVDYKIPPTSYTVTGSTPDEVIADAMTSPSPILKVKAGVGDDWGIISKLTETFPGYLYRIDVNQGWTMDEAIKKISLLEKLNIELIEEPVKGSFEEIEIIAKETSIPVFIDESFQTMEDLYCLLDKAPSVKGLVVKLAKSGGPIKALSLIHAAHKNGLDVMLSSMVESSVGVRAAASIAPLCRYVDLDSPWLFKQDPFNLLKYNGNKIILPDNLSYLKIINGILAKLFINK